MTMEFGEALRAAKDGAQDDFVPWAISQSDALAEDWGHV